jgi:hypothetical protein
MTTSHSIESKIMWTALMLFALSAAACGGSTQSMLGTAPSDVAAVAAATDDGGALSTLKEGNGKTR